MCEVKAHTFKEDSLIKMKCKSKLRYEKHFREPVKVMRIFIKCKSNFADGREFPVHKALFPARNALAIFLEKMSEGKLNG